MPVTLIQVGVDMHFPRSYVSGFVGSVGVSNMIISGDDLIFDYLAPLITVQLRIRPNVLAPTSNRYTLMYVFDDTNSQVYLSGAPIAAGVGVQWFPMQTRQEWRIRVLATLSPDESQRADWGAVPGYWRVLG